MNQERLTATVVARLQREAMVGPFEWVPAVGLRQPDGTAHGVAVEIFGEHPTRDQLDALARVLFRLGTNGRIEVQEFKPNHKAGRLGSPHGSDQTVYQLVGPGSQPLRRNVEREYGVRLKRD